MFGIIIYGFCFILFYPYSVSFVDAGDVMEFSCCSEIAW
jgi:hypothetical protein